VTDARAAVGGDDLRGPLDIAMAATLVLDAEGRVVGWSRAAEELLGYPAEEAVGRPADELLTGGSQAVPLLRFPERPHPQGARSGEIRLRHREGRPLDAALTLCPLALPAAGASWIVVATDAAELRHWESQQSMLRGLFSQSPVALCIYDTDLNVAWTNVSGERELNVPLAQLSGTAAAAIMPEGRYLSRHYPTDTQSLLARVLRTGESVVDLHYRGRPPSDPLHDHYWSCAYFRLQDAAGRVLGVCEESVDITDRYRAQARLKLLVRAGANIGTTLDARRIADEFADVVVPEFADAVTVDVLEAVLTGGELGPGREISRFRRLERRTVRDGWPEARTAVGGTAVHPPSSPQARSLATGRPVHEESTGQEVHSRLAAPLRARDSVIGVVTFLRAANPDPFDAEERALAGELAARTAVCLDNARRFAREHAAALTLQRSLLPQSTPKLTAVEVAHRYLPAATGLGVGGDWFDVIPLSGARVGLVVGDVVGHGLRAAATMGRLRTTVRALAQLDQPPDELLARLDSLLGRPPGEEGGAGDPSEGDEDVGATCLYAVYDPVAGRCAIAGAGHVPPAVVRPDGTVTFPDVHPGPPLGLGNLPFETTEFELPEGSLVALFTDGLIEARGRDVDAGLDRLAEVLAEPWRPLEDLCDLAVATLLPEPPSDDAALLLVRTRTLDGRQVAAWELDPDPALVGEARKLATAQLTAWGLDELALTAELVVSELVTNVIRYAPGPVGLRLIRDRSLICEVSDAGHTSPHPRRAAQDDEGGRGLFLVAQLTERWGTRYTPTGKTIWTEQSLPTGRNADKSVES